MDVWKGDLILNTGHSISDIHLSLKDSNNLIVPLPQHAHLRFLALVHPAQIPLHLICGPKLDVWTSSPETESYFGNILLNDTTSLDSSATSGREPWWQTTLPESPLGILASVDLGPGSTEISAPHPLPTEILFLATRTDYPSDISSNPQPGLSLHALPLLSTLLKIGLSTPTCPLSPDRVTTESSSAPIKAAFLPSPHPSSHPPQSPQKRKRDSLDTAFTAATERRHRAARTLASTVTATAASSHAKDMPSLRELHANAAAAAAASRRSSVAGPAAGANDVRRGARAVGSAGSRSRPGTPVFGPVDPAPVSDAASAVKASEAHPGMSAGSESASFEHKNQVLLRRLIMAGLRVHGLTAPATSAATTSVSSSFSSLPSAAVTPRRQTTSVQRGKCVPVSAPLGSNTGSASLLPMHTKHESAASSAAATSQPPAVSLPSTHDNEPSAEVDSPEDFYKAVYAHTHRAALFALRRQFKTTDLTRRTEDVREVVDRLLGVFFLLR